MTEAAVSFAGNLTGDPEVRYTERGIARAKFLAAVSGRREQEASFFTVIVWRDQAEHVTESLSKGGRVVAVGRLQQRSRTAEDGSARSTVEVVADELGPSLRWATAVTTRATMSSRQWPARRPQDQTRPPPGALQRHRPAWTEGARVALLEDVHVARGPQIPAAERPP